MRNCLFLTIMAGTLLTASCSDNNAQKAAEDMLLQAEKYFGDGKYDRAKIAIDSLRMLYPNAVETRKKALTLFQNISLKEAQEDLAVTDSALLATTKVYEEMKRQVDEAKAQLRATPNELETLTKTKMKLDSLKVRFDMQCAKIKYIHKKQKE